MGSWTAIEVRAAVAVASGFLREGKLQAGLSVVRGTRTAQREPMPAPATDPAAVVQRQLDAFNARDVEALLAVYADNAELFEHPAKLLARGAAELRERFSVRFREPNLHAALLHRVVMGQIVVDHEKVTRTFPEGPGTIELLMIYEVQAGRIARAWTMAGARNLP